MQPPYSEPYEPQSPQTQSTQLTSPERGGGRDGGRTPSSLGQSRVSFQADREPRMTATFRAEPMGWEGRGNSSGPEAQDREPPYDSAYSSSGVASAWDSRRAEEDMGYDFRGSGHGMRGYRGSPTHPACCP